MNAKIIDGKELSINIRKKIYDEAIDFQNKFGRSVGLAVVLVGENPASQIYVKNKITACEQTAIKSFSYYLPADVTQTQLLDLIDTINNDNNIDGLLVQLPLPKHIDENYVLSKINPCKDVDGFHAINAGNLLLGNPSLNACTPSGIIELIKSTNLSIEGKNAVVIGRSNIVGKPISMLLLQNNATVTICHSKTANIKQHTLNADILVVAIGRKEFVTGDMIKKGAIVIDVGMNRVDGKLYGDVNFPQAEQIAGYITPVPGGVGPMTITMLMSNTVKAAKLVR